MIFKINMYPATRSVVYFIVIQDVMMVMVKKVIPIIPNEIQIQAVQSIVSHFSG